MTIHLPATSVDRTRSKEFGPTADLLGQADRRAHVEHLVIVDLAAGDTDTVQAVFAGLSPHSRYRRFQTARPTLPAAALRGLAAMQPDRHVAHVALWAGRPVGLVRWIRWGDTRSAEIAYEVVDAAQHQGIGLALLRRAARSALAGGIEFFLVLPWAGDDRQDRLLRRLGGRPDPARSGLHSVPVAAVATQSRDGRSSTIAAHRSAQPDVVA